MKSRTNLLVILIIALAVSAGVYSNLTEQFAKDYSKLPKKVEEDRGFQRWITNLRNKDLVIEADNLKLLEEVEIYNTKWMKVSSIEDEQVKQEYVRTLEVHRNLEKVIFSPSDREFLDFRNEDRNGYKNTEVRFYGQKEDKVLDLRALGCSPTDNCYFDRAYFINNDVFVVTEFSKFYENKEKTIPEGNLTCPIDQKCVYSVKLHLLDLVNNSRLVYTSQSFELNLQEFIPNL